MTEPQPSAKSRKSPSELRKHIRHSCVLGSESFLVVRLEGEPGRKRVRNLSAGGLSLVLDYAVEPGTELNVELCNLTRNFCRAFRIRVVYCAGHPAGYYVLGCAFTRELGEDEVQGLL